MATPAIAFAFKTDHGAPHPLGATIRADGVNFSLFSASATGVELLLFDKHDSPQPFQTIPLIPSENKTFHFWHIFVKDLKARRALRLSCERSVGAGIGPPAQPQQGAD
jgi:pullulanase/glycogen debranching enzyme